MVPRKRPFQPGQAFSPKGKVLLLLGFAMDFDSYFQATPPSFKTPILMPLSRIWEGFHKNSKVKPQVLANAGSWVMFLGIAR